MAKQRQSKAHEGQCGYSDCRRSMPARYGEPGVSLSRHDNQTLVCSECGRREAFGERPRALLKAINGGARSL